MTKEQVKRNVRLVIVAAAQMGKKDLDAEDYTNAITHFTTQLLAIPGLAEVDEDATLPEYAEPKESLLVIKVCFSRRARCGARIKTKGRSLCCRYGWCEWAHPIKADVEPRVSRIAAIITRMTRKH